MLGMLIPFQNRERFANLEEDAPYSLLALSPAFANMTANQAKNQILTKPPVNVNTLARELDFWNGLEGFDNPNPPSVSPYKGPATLTGSLVTGAIPVTYTGKVSGDTVYLGTDSVNTYTVRVDTVNSSMEGRYYSGMPAEFNPALWSSYSPAGHGQIVLNIGTPSTKLTAPSLKPYEGFAILSGKLITSAKALAVSYTAMVEQTTVFIGSDTTTVFMVQFTPYIRFQESRYYKGTPHDFNPANWATYTLAAPGDIVMSFISPNGIITPSSGVVTPSSGVVTPSSGVVTPSSGVVTPSSGVVTPSSGLNPIPVTPSCPTCPTCPDMSQYIKMDEIPCWNCSLP